MEDHNLAMSKTKIRLMDRADSAFFTHVLFSLKTIWNEDIPTAATDGKNILINPHFFMSLSVEERIFILIHEAMHCAYKHVLRAKDKNKSKWNYATDYVINLQLVERNFTMPSAGLLDRQYAGMSAEEVYALLPEQQEYDVQLLDLQDPANTETLDQEMDDVLIRASIQSKIAGDRPGTIPGDIDIYLDRLLNPKLHWTTILRKWVQAQAKTDYSWHKPNRRYFPKHILPGLRGEKLINIAVAIDTSGSVSDEEFRQMASEFHTILNTLKPEKMTLIQFDSSIKHIDVIKTPTDLMQVRFTGRGGTEISPVLQWAEDNKPALLLVFTDGGFYHTQQTLKMPVLWLIHNNPRWTAPFGKVIHYEIQ